MSAPENKATAAYIATLRNGEPTLIAAARQIAAKDAEIALLREALAIIAGPPERDPDLPPIYEPRWSKEQCRHIARAALAKGADREE